MTFRKLLRLSAGAHGMLLLLGGDGPPALTARRGLGPVVIEGAPNGVSHFSGRKGGGHEKIAAAPAGETTTGSFSAEKETDTF